ncbi:hypothetical protein [Methylomonas rosea]|uniref:Apea-like HEPN domain-containing protein n=1 Tax=Methylomonas rosea TaxID=2952227 RepID=A0ABT1TNN1_9GAMM|nr:hypothetical protein [Methylomonas sp. WSC-7]MCQ8116382.1 hypothetical protein [Methylomonas sp. WSC-7]
MNSIFDDYDKKFYLYIFPIERIKITTKHSIENMTIYPAGYLDVDELLNNIVYLDSEENEKINGQLKYFKDSTLIAFSDSAFHDYPGSVASDEQIIRRSFQKVECVIDFLKFKYCDFSNPKKLPGRVGQISTGETLLLMIHMPYTRIINKTVSCNVLTVGNGLKIQENTILEGFNFSKADIAEVGHIAKHALKLYSAALEENSDTNKFIQIMRIFEFIAFPSEYKRFEKVKEQILSHIAKNKTDILRIREEFVEYSRLRTEIIHNGKALEEFDLVPNPLEREYLIDKLQSYLRRCINDLIDYYNNPWIEIDKFRVQKKRRAEKNEQPSEEEACAKSIVVVDSHWLSEHIGKYSQIYREIYPDKSFQKIKPELICYHILTNTRTIEYNRIFLFYVFYYELDGTNHFGQDVKCFDKQNLLSGNLTLQFHVMKMPNLSEMIKGIDNIINYICQDKNQNMFDFKNIVFCGDRAEYADILKNTASSSNINIVIVKDSHTSEMGVDIPFFHVGHLTGISLGLTNDEL